MSESKISAYSSSPDESAAAKASRRNTRAATAAASVVGILLLGGGALGAGYRVASNRVANDRAHIAPGVKIAGLSVGGLTPNEAKEKVRGWARTQMNSPVTFIAPVSGRKWNITLGEVGGRFDIDPAVEKAFAVGKNAGFWDTLVHTDKPWNVAFQPDFKLNPAQIDKHLAVIAKKVDHAPKNAVAKVTETGALEVAAPEEPGVHLDIAATRDALLKGGPDSLRDGGETKLIIAETKPTVTAADFSKVGTLLSSFHTGYGSSSESRRYNVELAASHINGTLLGPGEIFSYNKVVGPREPYLGWKDAPTYQDGQVVPGPGGGVCQVSTTLYNAALRAGLKIVRRSHHSMPVHYVNPGCDATVAYDDIDFQFENSTSAPLLLLAKTDKGTLTFNLFGAAPAKPFKVDIISGDRHENASGSFTVTTWRETKYDDGTTTRERLSTDTYEPYNGGSSSRPRPKPAARPAATAGKAKPAASPAPKPVTSLPDETKPAPAGADAGI